MFNVDNNYDIPRDVINCESLCQVTGRNEIIFENYKYIKSISETEIELICKKYKIHIMGRNLIIKYYNNESMVIGGCIDGITFC
jgi:sporulation protein YqfC